MSNKKSRKKRKKTGSLKAFFLSILISLLLIIAIAAIVLFILYPENLMTNELLYDICMKLVQFFSVIFVLSVAAIWINSKDLEEVDEAEILPDDYKCRYSSAMLNPKPFDRESDETLEKSHPLGRLNDYWEEIEEGFSNREYKELLEDTAPSASEDGAKLFVTDLDDFDENDDFEDIHDVDGEIISDEYNYSYAFKKPDMARGVVLPVRQYIPFEDKDVEPFPYFEDGVVVPRYQSTYPYDYSSADSDSSDYAENNNLDANEDEELVLRAFDDYEQEDSPFDEDEEETRLEDNDELSLPLSDVLPDNDGFEDVLHYVKPIFSIIPFILYEDLILDEKFFNPRPFGVESKGLVPFKYIQERIEVQEEAVSLGFIAPKQPEPVVAESPTFNFSINSDDGALRGRSGEVVPFEYYKDLLANEIELTYRDDSVKSSGIVKFVLYSQDEPFKIEDPIAFSAPKFSEDEFTKENIMDNFLAPENIFSNLDNANAQKSTLSSQDELKQSEPSAKTVDKWWEDFEYIPGKAKEKKADVSDFTLQSLSPYKVSSDDADINSSKGKVIPFVCYEDLLLDVIEVNRREDCVQSQGLIPFKYLERKLTTEQGLSGFAPVSIEEDKVIDNNDNNVQEVAETQRAEKEEFPIQESEAVAPTLAQIDTKDSVDVVRIPSDNPNNPYYNALYNIEDIDVSTSSVNMVSKVSGFDGFANGIDDSKRDKWWEDFEYIPGKEKSGFTEKWWDDFEYVKPVAKPQDSSTLNYSVSSDDGQLRGRLFNVIPFTYYEDLLVDEIVINDRDEGVQSTALIPFVFLEELPKEDNSPDTFAPTAEVISRPENPNNPSYGAMWFVQDIKTDNSLNRFTPFNVAGFDTFSFDIPKGAGEKWWEDFEYIPGKEKSGFTEKWWDDFEYVPGEAKSVSDKVVQDEPKFETEEKPEEEPLVASNLLDKYYAQMFDIDEWDFYKNSFLSEDVNQAQSSSEEEDNTLHEKWWEDFVFIPGYAKEKPVEAQEQPEELADDKDAEQPVLQEQTQQPQDSGIEDAEPRIISLIEEEMASSLDIDYPLTIAKIESDKIDEIFALDWVDIVAFRIDKKSACMVFIALDKKESIDIINTIKNSVDKNIRYKISELAGRKIDKRSFLAEISA